MHILLYSLILALISIIQVVQAQRAELQQQNQALRADIDAKIKVFRYYLFTFLSLFLAY